MLGLTDSDSLLHHVFIGARRVAGHLLLAAMILSTPGLSAADTPPTVATPANATPNPVTGTSTTLRVLGAYTGMGGESSLRYTWTTTGTPPASVLFTANGTHAARTTITKFTVPGNYSFVVTITDPFQNAVTSSTSVVVQDTATTMALTPLTVRLNPGAVQAFTVTVKDQFGVLLVPQPPVTWIAAGGGISTAGSYTAGAPGGPFTITATSGSLNKSAAVTINAPPTVVTPATASANPVTGTTVSLTALGTDDLSASLLKYTWSTTGTVPATVSFSPNGTNAAQSVTATIKKAGNYTFLCTIKDGGNLTVTTSVAVTVSQTPTAMTLSPAAVRINPSASKTFTAVLTDQFGAALATQPSLAWSVNGGQAITSAGVFTASATPGGPYTVTASGSGVTGTTTVTVNAPPTVASAAAISPTPVVGTTATVSALGADDAGAALLKYTWATSGSVPAAVTFTPNKTNAAQSAMATFAKAGTYTIKCTITDGGGLTAVTSTSVTVQATATSLQVTPLSTTVTVGTTQSFSASLLDQFGRAITPQPTVTWSVTGSNSISSAGLFTAGATPGGPFTVSASGGGFNGTASVTVTNTPPTIASPASVAANPVTGTSTGLSVLGQSVHGASSLIYTWSTTGVSPSTVTFTPNGTNAASASTATFTASGAYVLQCVVTDGFGGTASSSVAVSVVPTLTTITVSPSSATVPLSGTTVFTDVASDQFGLAFSPQPAMGWAVTGPGSIDGFGTFSAAPTPGGPYSVTATDGLVTGAALVTVMSMPPTIVTAANAASNPVSGTTVALSVLGTDDAGASSLTYTWSVVGTPPGSVWFTPNGTTAAQASIASFTAVGAYTLQCSITDPANLTVISTVAVSVVASPTALTVTPAMATSQLNGTAIAYSATVADQFGNPFTNPPAVSWSVPGAAGTISASGQLVAAGSPGGPYTVTGSCQGALGTAEVTIVDMPPTVAVPANAVIDPTGMFALLSVLGSDDGGEQALTYTWEVVGTAPGSVVISPNGTQAAQAATATFSTAGTYTLQATITDASNQSATSSVVISVSALATSIGITPANASVGIGTTTAYAAVALDQFGIPLMTQPSFSWAVTTGGGINSQGLFTAGGSAGGPLTLTAQGAGLSGYTLVWIIKPALQVNTIGTIAGTGGALFAGDGGAALVASVNTPNGVLVDASGALIIDDYYNHALRRVNGATGLITTIAGTGLPGFSGDGGLATAAQFCYPASMALDVHGNLYIADQLNARIRMIAAGTGIITTIAGNGNPIIGGDGGPASAATFNTPYGVAVDPSGNIFVSDYIGNTVRRIDAGTHLITTIAGTGALAFSGDGQPATQAALANPTLLACDLLGNVYVSDFSNNRIRKITVSTGIITTVAGTGSTGFSGDGGPATAATLTTPNGVLVDPTGTVYIGDFGNNAVRRVDGQSGLISTVAGTGTAGFSGDGGNAVSASVTGPAGLCLDSHGNLVVADRGNNRIRIVTPGPVFTRAATASPNPVLGSSTAVTVLGGSVSGEGSLTYAWSSSQPVVFSQQGTNSAKNSTAAFSAGGINLCTCTVSDASGRSMSTSVPVDVIALSNPSIMTVVGTGSLVFTNDGILGWQSDINASHALAVDTQGNLIFCDEGDNRVRRMGAISGLITTIAGGGSTPGTGDGALATLAGLSNTLWGVAADAAGSIYISDSQDSCIRKVAVGSGIITTIAGNGTFGYGGDGGPATAAMMSYPAHLALDARGTIYVADYYNHCVRMISQATGVISTIAGTGTGGFSGDGGPAAAATLLYPLGVACDASGNLYIADTGNDRIRRVDHATGIISTVVGNGSGGDGARAITASLNAPSNLTIDGSGNLYIADTGNQRIRVVYAATGTIVSLAGNGNQGTSYVSGGNGGDGGPAYQATFAAPEDIQTNASGDLFVVDTSVNRIRLITSKPVVANPIIAGENPVIDPSTTLSVLGASPFGESALTYTWSVLGTTAGAVTFTPNGTNAAKSTVMQFTAAGSYEAQVTIQDPTGAHLTTSILLIVLQSPGSLGITPSPALVLPGATQQFTLVGADQFGLPLLSTADVQWSVSGGGQMSSTGLFTANNALGGPFTVLCAGVNVPPVQATAPLTVYDIAPTIAVPAAASPSQVASKTTTLSVLGASWLGEQSLAYTWCLVGPPSSAVDISANDSKTNGTHASSTTVVAFSAGGTYTFRVTATDPYGLSASSSVVVTVANQNPTFPFPASATPNPVTGTLTRLAACAASVNGESTLTYAWTVLGTPPAHVALGTDVGTNGTNPAKVTTATFSAPGTYVFQVTATDGYGLSASSQVTVTVLSTITSLAIAPNPMYVDPNGTQAFTASGVDQFGATMSLPAGVTWTLTNALGLGQLSSTGSYTANAATGGPSTVTATYGGLSAMASLYVEHLPPVAANQALYTTLNTPIAFTLGGTSPDQDPLTWSIATGPAHGALSGTPPSMTYTPQTGFAGMDQLTFTASDGYATSAPATVTIQVLGQIAPETSSRSPLIVPVPFDPVQWGSNTAYQASYVASPEPGRIWQSAAGAPGVPTLVALSNSLTMAPSRFIYASSGGTITLAVQGAPNAPVTFLALGDAQFNPADPTVSLSTNCMTVIANDAGMASVSVQVPLSGRVPIVAASPLAVGQVRFVIKVQSPPLPPPIPLVGVPSNPPIVLTVINNLPQTGQGGVPILPVFTSIQVTPNPVIVAPNGFVALSAVALDQFGQPLVEQPTFSWGLTDSFGIGTLNQQGVFFATSVVGGPSPITVSCSGISTVVPVSVQTGGAP